MPTCVYNAFLIVFETRDFSNARFQGTSDYCVINEDILNPKTFYIHKRKIKKKSKCKSGKFRDRIRSEIFRNRKFARKKFYNRVLHQFE